MEWKSEQIGELAKALAAAQAQIKGSKKSAVNPHFRSDYSELCDVWDAIRDPLTAHGLSVTQPTDVVGDKQICRTVLMHAVSGQWIMGTYELAPEKRTPQGFGSALSYARRYCLAAMVGVAPKDDDGEAATDRDARSPSNVAPIETMAAKITPNSTWAELADYRVPMGKKYKGKRLGEVPVEELKNFLDWLAQQPELDNRAREFLLIGDSFYQQATARDMVGNGL